MGSLKACAPSVVESRDGFVSTDCWEQALRERIMQLPSRAASTQEMERINEQRDAAANECAKLVQAIEVWTFGFSSSKHILVLTGL